MGNKEYKYQDLIYDIAGRKWESKSRYPTTYFSITDRSCVLELMKI